jgi:serine/threonine protein kinase
VEGSRQVRGTGRDDSPARIGAVMSAHLRVQSGPEPGRIYPLTSGSLLKVGRADTCDIHLPDPYISRVHFTLLLVGHQAIVASHSSKGTFLNGERLTQEERIQTGDVLKAGGTELVFETETPLPRQPTMLDQLPDAATPDDLATFEGQQLGHFILDEVLGIGNTGVVFRARDTRDGMTEALKVFVPAFAANEEQRQRFIRTLATVRTLKHPHLIKVYDAGQIGHYCWLSMEHVDGESLTQILAKRGESDLLEWEDAYQVAVQVAQALEYAHGQGVVHRNITPANILVRTRDKHVFLGDLMLAKALDGTGARQVTRMGETLGELAYLPPERIQQADLDPRSDLYGLGATLFHLLTGRPPFVAKGMPQLLSMIADQLPPPLRQSQTNIPSWFEVLVLKMLCKRVEDRPASATELLAELERGKKAAAPPPASELRRPRLRTPTPKEEDRPLGFLSPPQEADELGRLGHFRVRKQLGAGGMGMVFLAEDTQLQRPVALKVMRHDIAALPSMHERFIQEARLMASLRSDHIVTVYQVGEQNNVPFMAMELLEGMPLEDWLTRGKRMTPKQIVRVGQEIAFGLAAAHARGVIHRDIKPANLWLEAPRGRIKILDFGLARPLVRTQALTQENTVIGTPYYMAPEQAQCEPLDHRADLFSLGCVLYELCSGRVPFDGDTPMSVMTAIITQAPAPLDIISHETPPELGLLVSRLLAKNRDNRPPNAEAVARAFEALKAKVA